MQQADAETERVFAMRAPAPRQPQRSRPRSKRVLVCEGCGVSGVTGQVRRRLCSGGEALCSSCRGAPEHRLMSESLLRRNAPWLPAEEYPAPVGSTVNCKHPAFRRQRMYAWGDVALRCAVLGLPLPE